MNVLKETPITSDNVTLLQASDAWGPACGGTETPFTTRTGKRLLYVYNYALGRHAYLDLGSDLILTDEEARNAIGL